MLVMGILNVTPDSFADGGKFDNLESAIVRAKEMIAEGVDIIDVGGESTRPGSDRISIETELDRVIPVISEIAKLGTQISIDTMRSQVASKAVKAGATIINDVSGGLADLDMLATAARLNVPYIAMHWRGHSKNMNDRAHYGDVVKEVIAELQLRIDAALAAGISAQHLIVDPGIGFAKDKEHNWAIIDSISSFVDLGYPVLVGASRKRFLGGDSPDEREAATIELTRRLSTTGVWGVRVHSVREHKNVMSV